MEEDGDFAKLLEDEIMNSDTTECSTSFDDSDSGDTLSDSEVLSDFCGGKGSAMDFDGYAKKRYLYLFFFKFYFFHQLSSQS